MAIAVGALGKLSTVLSAIRGNSSGAAGQPSVSQTREALRDPVYTVVGTGGRAADDDEADKEWCYWWSRSVSF